MLSTHERSGGAQLFSESLATFGLITVIASVSRNRPSAVPFAVGAYIAAAYWFTSSTSFANPAVTIARALTDTFAGIRPIDVPAFVLAQIVGAVIATTLFGWQDAADRIVARQESPLRTVDSQGASSSSRSEV